MRRRDFCLGSALALSLAGTAGAALPPGLDLAAGERGRVLAAARRYLAEAPTTITDFPAPRSPGSPHDYYSEGDYWWPDPANPGGPYIRRDGYSNPDKFTAHREALIRLSVQLPALAAAFRLTRDVTFAEYAERHLRAWFVAPATRMSPHLNHAQAVIGVNTGRGIGIIDTLHLVEVARATAILRRARAGEAVYTPTIAWFNAYLTWMTTSANGIDERDQKNNHGTCWALQVAEFARLTGRGAETEQARARIKALIPGQIAADGSQPLELARTKPYAYCLFNLDVLAACAHILSDLNDDLWHYQGGQGGSIAEALTWMAPFIADKSTWPKPPDVEAWADWPVRQPSLLFGGLALGRADYLTLWHRLDPDPTDAEIIRNYPLRQPILWVGA
ncbi:alginate lyase family protein [Niveispirillum sp. KHB5.9]|uniref:alginate lyase family protein n=1 Tax=Niveispirillum sp. KHB5.9 TaxID=3400269 RepID=UPI003A892605